MTAKAMKINNPIKQNQIAGENDIFNIYPNPASNELWVECYNIKR
ncbi:MAG: hypothetical protein ABIJ97_16785 [Bacteroidota bacterium]